MEQQNEKQNEQEQNEVVLEFTVTYSKDGSISIKGKDSEKEMDFLTVENVSRTLADKLRETRIANMAVEMFKEKLR